MRRSSLLLALTSGLITVTVVPGFSSCGTQAECNATNCSNGCCDSAGVCRPGFEGSACGSRGAACATCGAEQICQLGFCTGSGGGGGGGGGGSDAGHLDGGGGADAGHNTDAGTDGGVLPTDCTVSPCPNTHYCDLGSKQCKPGCASQAQCGADRTCDLASHTCKCNSGTHDCSGTCRADDSPDYCGNTCVKCTTAVANAVPACVNSACAIKCNPGFFLCNGQCVGDDNPTACGATCAVCQAATAGGMAGCNVGVCGTACATGNYFNPSQSACVPWTASPNTSTAALTFTKPVPYFDTFDSEIAVWNQGSISRFEVDSNGVSASPTALLAAATQPTAFDLSGGYTFADYYIGVVSGGTVKLTKKDLGQPDETCEWSDPAFATANAIAVNGEGAFSGGTGWVAVGTPTTIKIIRFFSGTFGSAICSTSTRYTVATGTNLKLHGIPTSGDSASVVYSDGTTLYRVTVSSSNGPGTPQGITLAAAPDEVATKRGVYVRVGSNVYLPQFGSTGTLKKLAGNVTHMGPRPVDDNSERVCMVIGGKPSCAPWNNNSDSAAPFSVVSADTANFIFLDGSVLLYRTSSAWKIHNL